MKIANVVLKKTIEESGETRRIQRTSVRMAPIEVASVATEADFIPLADEVLLASQDTVASVISVQTDINFFKDVKPTKLQPAKGFEFSERKFSMCAVVSLPLMKVSSRDPFVATQTFQPQVALLPVWGEIELPQGAKYAGVLELEGYAIAAHDSETKQAYQLGYRFPTEDQVNWIGLALTRRKHWKRSEKENIDEMNAPMEAYSSLRFTTDDGQVIARIAQKFGRGKRLPDDSVTFTLTDPEDFEACQQIVREVTQLRQAAAISNDHAAMEALQ